MKRYTILPTALALVLLLSAVGCAPQPAQESAPPAEEAQLELTLEELAAYNGKDGNPAYIAVEGVIYDVSGSSRWKQGEHNGFNAGQDLTEEISSISPHGASVLSRLPIVGKLVD